MKKKTNDPYQIVADALQIKKSELTLNSCMGETPNWDSLNHISVICAIETACEINIKDDDLLKYSTIKNIILLFENKTQK